MMILFLLIGSISLILFSVKCPPKAKLVWYEKEIIYEIDIEMFRDSNRDGRGDIKGVQEKVDYLERNLIKTILFQSNVFSNKDKIDLLTMNQQICNENHLQKFVKIINRKGLLN
jgi:glycosidase